jgi:molecular chaperone IbpA
VAGFDRNELELETENGTLKVKGRKVATMGERQFLHQGIAERDFELAFKLSQHVEVQGPGWSTVC